MPKGSENGSIAYQPYNIRASCLQREHYAFVPKKLAFIITS